MTQTPAQARGDADRPERVFALLTRAYRLVLEATDIDTLLTAVCRLLVDEGGLRMAWIGRVDTAARVVRPSTWAGHVDGYLTGLSISIDEVPEGMGPTGRAYRAGADAAREGAHFISQDIASDPLMAPWRDRAVERGYLSCAAFPLVADGRVVAVFSIYAAEPGWFDPQRVVLLDVLVAHLSLAIAALERRDQRERLEEQLRQAQKMEAIGTLAGGIAHDFNNLLTGILGFAELALNGLPDESPVRADIAEVVKSAQSAALLTSQLLAFSRKSVVRPEELDVNEVIVNLRKILQRVLGEDIHLRDDLREGLGPVRMDRGQLEQIVMNLVANARDAMPNGGRLTISTALLEVDHQEHVRGLGLEPGPFVQLVVADTGCGMSPQLQARIFEPFFTTKPVGEGTGLGLATVYGIVTQARGAVTVESEEGVGTSFSVLLPIAVARGTLDTHDDIDVEARGAETILFVEDEPGLRALGERLLQHQGYTVLVAGSAEDALRQLEADPRSIDLLVTDIVMPGLSGRALASEVRAMQPAVRVLFTSGYPRRGMEITSGFNGSDPVAFLPKPYSREALLRAVRQVLKHA